MTTENTLVPAAPAAAPIALPDFAALQQASAFSDNFTAVAGTGISFLPYLSLFGGSSDAVKEGTIPIATYGLTEGKEKQITPLGKTLVVVPLAYRTKAMKTKDTPDGKPWAFHNHQSREFKEIRAIADNKALKNSGCMYGPEFLFWLPEQKRYCTFFMGSPTARNASIPVHALLPSKAGIKVGVLSSVLIDNGENKWHGPVINVSTQSVTPPDETAMQVMTDFLNPRDSQVVEAAPADAANADR